MSSTNPTFKNKEERNEFYIALGVIVLFGLFFWGVMGRGEIESPLPGSNEVVVASVDSDGDGVYDQDDRCPYEMGSLDNDGCPVAPLDTDGDGIADANDMCPKYAGKANLNGCPPDTDGDGVHDGKDLCPSVKGSRKDKGCLPDADGDGIYDKNDKCPNLFGIKANNGCPEVKIAEEDMTVLALAMRSVEFETGKSSLKSTSFSTLDKISGMMKKYPRYKLSIGGHTDNVGDAQNNLALSQSRAKTCYDYLIAKGVPPRKLSHKGYGMRLPLQSNDTAPGRQANRRVEFKFNY